MPESRDPVGGDTGFENGVAQREQAHQQRARRQGARDQAGETRRAPWHGVERDRFVQNPEPLVEQLVEQLEEQRFPGREVQEHGALGQPGAAGDGRHGDGLVGLALEQGARRRQDGRAASFLGFRAARPL